jgi:hypothetical protein
MKKLLVLFVFSVLAGCGPAPAVLAEPTQRPAAILTPTEAALSPSATIQASLTPAPTATATLAPTSTPTIPPAPLGRYDEFVVTRVEYRSVGGIALTLKLPGVTRGLNLELGGIKFTCTFDPAYPDALFCPGLSSPPLDTRLPITFTDPLSGQALYQGEVTLRQTMFPTPTPISPSGNWCPERGQKVEVEWECRIYDNNPCVVATVYDACGYWHSVHSCPDNMELPSPNCSAEQFAAMRKLYGFP